MRVLDIRILKILMTPTKPAMSAIAAKTAISFIEVFMVFCQGSISVAPFVIGGPAAFTPLSAASSPLSSHAVLPLISVGRSFVHSTLMVILL